VTSRWWPLLACAVAGWSLGGWYVGRVEADPWHLVPLAGALALLAGRRGEARDDPPPLTASLAMALFAVGVPFLPPLLSATCLAVAATLAASPCFFGRRLHAGFGGLLLLALPTLPALQLVVGYPLRVASGTLAAALLRVGGVPAARAGATLEVGGELYSIDAPCSGISMWWTALVVVAWLAARANASVGRTLAGAAVATALVVAGNALRSAALVRLELSRLPAPEWRSSSCSAARRR